MTVANRVQRFLGLAIVRLSLFARCETARRQRGGTGPALRNVILFSHGIIPGTQPLNAISLRGRAVTQ